MKIICIGRNYADQAKEMNYKVDLLCRPLRNSANKPD